MSRHKSLLNKVLQLIINAGRQFAVATTVAAALAVSPLMPVSADAATGIGGILDADPVSNVPLAPTEIAQRLQHAAVWIKAPMWTGSGWLLDAERGLIITNQHVTGHLREVEVYFPEFRDGRLIAEKSYYEENVRPIRGIVLDTDARRDLAIIQLERVPEHAVALPLASESAQQAERVHTLGGNPRGSEEGLWIYTSGSVRQVYERPLGNGGRATAIEYDMPTNPGNSGGAVVNDRGEIVGVHEQGDPEARDVCGGVDVSELRAYLDEVLPLVDPRTAEDFIRRGERRMEFGWAADAAEDFTAALRLEPGNPTALAHRGFARIGTNDLSTAMGDFNEALDRDPSLVLGYRGRGYGLALQGQIEAALADATEAIRRSEQPNEEYYWRGMVHLATGDANAALEDFARAIADDTSTEWAVKALVGRGQAQMNLGHPELAQDEFVAAQNLQPYDDSVVNLVGLSLYAQQRYAEAFEMFDNAMQMDYMNAEYRARRGFCLWANGQYADAEGELLQAAQLDPASALPHEGLGLVYRDAGLNQNDANLVQLSVQQFTTCLELAPNSAYYHFLRGGCRQLLQDAGAQEDLDRAHQLDPETYKQYDRRYLLVENASAETIRVYVSYYTLGTDGAWYWYDAGSFDIAPGQTAQLLHGSLKICGQRARMWAEGLELGGEWEYREVELVPAGGYISGEGIQNFIYKYE
jgi:tetratricopeptide (TPR) repeat protein